MVPFPDRLLQKLEQRKSKNSLRQLPDVEKELIDFSSNDYLGFADEGKIANTVEQILERFAAFKNGATGSRLITGNHVLYKQTEIDLARFHKSESALIFNSGYDANLGFFSAVPQRGDLVLFDEVVHASIRDGISLGNARAQKYRHNHLEDLEQKIRKFKESLLPGAEVYVVTESVFSMDGDSPDLMKMAAICKKHHCKLVVDEAHAIGVFGQAGEGQVQNLDLQKDVFARIITFGKAMGCHGAAVLGSNHLKEFLVNFARSFIYTTGLPPHSVANIQAAYHQLEKSKNLIRLQENIEFFKLKVENFRLGDWFIESDSAIQCLKVGQIDVAKRLSSEIIRNGYDVRAILSPTVPMGAERLRICIHSFNTKEQIEDLLYLLKRLLD
ncbi:8-amino-7-oxononanoate synthase [Flavobacteriaceae bacterium MAR_2009_75]|nr:8-amino-7-oxononanoate synthase [Flavobacteriaceae bacterium MAR_2009_75]